MAKNKTVVKTQIADKEQNVEAPQPPKKLENEPTATEKLEEVNMEGSETPSKEPYATQPIPPVQDKVESADVSSEDIITHKEEVSEIELALGEMDDKRSIKFKIDPDNTKAPAYAVEDFRGFFEEYQEKKEAKPNVMFINTTSLEKLGYRDVAVDLGLTIKESTVYNEKELVLALDF